MLNRRLIRIKAMQAYYSYSQAMDVNYNIGREMITEHFQPDLNSMEPQDKVKLSALSNEALKVFENWFENNEALESDSPEVSDYLPEVKRAYDENLKKDVKSIHSFMLKDLENITKEYFLLIQFIVELSDFVRVEDSEKKSKRYSKDESTNIKFLESEIIDRLRTNEQLRKGLESHKISWSNDQSIVRNAYKKQLIDSEIFQKYLKEEGHEIELLRYIVKEIIFKNELIDEHLQQLDIHWDENKAVLKSLCVKTINHLEAEGEWKLLDISANWTEDKEFFEKLFKQVVKLDEELEEIISKHLVNWDIERVAITDKLIIKMALAEMMSFPGIPTKVSINEFIEISKNYSTPKSKQFVNGLLDKISKELIDSKKIKKSGRGLIDNK